MTPETESAPARAAEGLRDIPSAPLGAPTDWMRVPVVLAALHHRLISVEPPALIASDSAAKGKGGPGGPVAADSDFADAYGGCNAPQGAIPTRSSRVACC